MDKQVELIGEEGLRQAAECLRTLAHPSRLHIVQLLLTGQRYTVGELAVECQLTQPVTSEHLRLLQRCGFLHSQREGRQVYYMVAEPHLYELMACIRGRFGDPQGAATPPNSEDHP